MKVIDKTGKHNKNNWDYGTILKCWFDNSPGSFDIVRIGNADGRNPCNSFHIEILHDRDNDDAMTFYHSTFNNISELRENLKSQYDHVIPVKATITIEDL